MALLELPRWLLRLHRPHSAVAVDDSLKNALVRQGADNYKDRPEVYSDETQFHTAIDVLTDDPKDALVVMLGSCSLAEGVRAERLVRFPDASMETVEAVGAIDIRDFTDGVTLVVDRGLIESNFDSVRRIQKYLVYCYIKYIWFARQDSSTPDPLGVGGDKGPLANLAYQVNTQENLRHLMAHPRAKALERSSVSYPVLLLLPGESLQRIGPRLKELSRRFLVVCLSKTLGFCQEHDVTPDVVVQLDTHPQQANFYPGDMDLSESWLIALSCVPGKKYMNRFAGIFWIDAFAPQAYGSAYELRNSWLSSFIPMLGTAELFKPTHILTAGADLAVPATEPLETFSDVEDVAAVNANAIAIRMIDGVMGHSKLQFLATAYEAESIASEFIQKMGTLCCNVTQTGVLDASCFEPKKPEVFLDNPAIDRTAFAKAMRTAWKDGRRPEPNIIKKWVYEQVPNARFLVKQAEALSSMNDPKALEGNPLLSAAKLISHLHPVNDVSAELFMSRRIIERYERALKRSVADFRLMDWMRRSKQVVVMAMLDEGDEVKTAINKRFPGGRPNVRHTWEVEAEKQLTYYTPWIIPATFPELPVILMTRRYREAGDYLLSLLPLGHVLIVEDLLESPWP